MQGPLRREKDAIDGPTLKADCDKSNMRLLRGAPVARPGAPSNRARNKKRPHKAAFFVPARQETYAIAALERRVRYPANARPANPMPIMAQVEASGTVEDRLTPTLTEPDDTEPISS